MLLGVKSCIFTDNMTIRAYAKINLGLRVLRKREDGFHDIETVFHRINVFDEITLEPSPTIALTCSRHDLPTDEGNLCVRVAIELQKMLNNRDGVHLALKKNIPVGAGLGGGSSDAAAVLSVLPQWWNMRLSDEELFKLGLRLGADIPYFLKRGTAHAKGKGEILEYFPLEIPYWIVVVYPNLHISTAWAYQSLQVTGQREKGKSPESQTSLKDILLEHMYQPRMLLQLLRNDFEPTVLRTHEPVARVKQALYLGGAVFAQMAGSGSSVFGFFESERFAEEIARELGKQYQVFITPPRFEAYG